MSSENNNQNDHDLLIRMDTKLDMIHDAFSKHCEDDVAGFSQINNTVGTAHKRIDTIGERVDKFNGKLVWIAVSGILSIVVLAMVVLAKQGPF